MCVCILANIIVESFVHTVNGIEEATTIISSAYCKDRHLSSRLNAGMKQIQTIIKTNWGFQWKFFRGERSVQTVHPTPLFHHSTHLNPSFCHIHSSAIWFVSSSSWRVCQIITCTAASAAISPARFPVFLSSPSISGGLCFQPQSPVLWGQV